jgi:acetyl esterase/lipase
VKLFRILPLLIAASAASGAQLQEVVYRVVDGHELKMDLAIPEGAGPFPVVVCLHGGGWSMGSKRSFHSIIRGLAESGFVAATVQYRLAPAARHPAQVEDALAAVRFLREHAADWKIHPDRVALMGASAGAHLALLAGLPEAGRAMGIQAIVSISAPTDLRDWRMSASAEKALRESTGKSGDDLLADLLGSPNRTGALAESASPVMLVHGGSPPVLVFQWREDQSVPAMQAERLISTLARHGVGHEAVWFDGRGHALNGAGVETIVPRTVAFLSRVFPPDLRGPAPRP